jgi:GH25 family lysozyme M1 (1,4-beta-N-acetylmuramidase)
VVLDDGTTKQASQLTAADKVDKALPLAPQGSLKSQIGKNGATMGQMRYLPKRIQEAAAVGAADTPAPGSAPSPSAAAAPSTAAPASFTFSLTAPAVLPGLSMAVNNVPPYSFTDAGAILGQDVSSFQTGVNFATERAKGSQFTYIKTSEGQAAYENPAFGDQWVSATSAGLKRAAYHFALPSQSSGAAQAQYFVSRGGGWSPDGQTLPPALDIEWNPYPALGNMCFNMTQAQLRTWITDFQNTYKSLTGRYPMIYTATLWWDTCVGPLSTASRSPLWLASYAAFAGNMPAGTGWNSYDIWQYADSGTFAGDQNVFASTQAGLTSMTVDASYTPYGNQPPAPAAAPIGTGDVVVVDQSSGALYRYPNAANGLTSRVAIFSSGWGTAKSVHLTDANGDGFTDIVTQWNSGQLTLNAGNANGTFQGATTLGWGWAGLELTIGKWAAGDAYDSVLAVDPSNGGLRRYSFNGPALTYRGYVGWGWRGLHPRFVQTDGSGIAEVLARYADGTLHVYPRLSTGGFTGTAPQVGSGWNVMTQLAAVRSTSGSLLAKDTSANVRLYTFSSGRISYRGLVGVGGWDTHLLSGSQGF